MNNILTDGRNLDNLIKNNCVFVYQEREIYYIVSDNLITRKETNIADLKITEEVAREYNINNLTEWADDCSLDNGATQESDDLRKQFAKENITPGLADNVKKWVSKWRDKNEVRNKCYYFTCANSQFPFFTDWGDYFFKELNDEDKKTLIKKIKENDFNVLYGIENENENTTAIKLILSDFK